MFNNQYADVNYPIAYTGGLLLARGFIQKLYEHMGFHPAWKYEQVIELSEQASLSAQKANNTHQQVQQVRHS